MAQDKDNRRKRSKAAPILNYPYDLARGGLWWGGWYGGFGTGYGTAQTGVGGTLSEQFNNAPAPSDAGAGDAGMGGSDGGGAGGGL